LDIFRQYLIAGGRRCALTTRDHAAASGLPRLYVYTPPRTPRGATGSTVGRSRLYGQIGRFRRMFICSAHRMMSPKGELGRQLPEVVTRQWIGQMKRNRRDCTMACGRSRKWGFRANMSRPRKVDGARVFGPQRLGEQTDPRN
jgi:hypothetical protein